MHEIAGGIDPLRGADQDRLCRIAFGRERHHHGGVAQRRAVIGAADLDLGLLGERGDGHAEHLLGADAVAEHGERGADFRLRRRRLEVVDLGVGEIAKIADRSDAVPRQHIERVSERQSAVGRGVRRRAHVIAQALKRELEGIVRNGEAAVPRPRQKVGDVGVEPGIVAAGGPQSEGAFRPLAGKHGLDRIGDALVEPGVDGEMQIDRQLIGVEQRQRAADDLLGAAERIAVERLQQARHVERC